MKLDAGRIAAFLRDPRDARVVLLHGDDEGMVRHRADALTLAVVGQRDDPFRVAWLPREEHARLGEEAAAIAMLGGRRVVRVRDAVDGLTEPVRRVLAGVGDTLVLLECGALPGRSKLRVLVEAASAGVSIACYPEEGKALRGAIETGLAAGRVTIDAEALDWLCEHVGNDRGATRGEVEKLVLYAGAGQRLDLDMVRACVGDLGAVSFDDALFAATAGDVPQADLSIERTLAEGLAPVAITRGVAAHLGRLGVMRGHMAQGASAQDAVRLLRPPIFFKRVAALTQAAAWWSPARVMAGLREASRVEMMCKQTGAPDALLVRRLVVGLASQTAALRRRS